MTDTIRFFADDAAVRHLGEGLLARTLLKSEWTHEAHLAACLWLLTERPDVAPERDLIYNSGPREVVVQIDLDAKRPEHGKRAPMNLAVVLDRSGSMQGAINMNGYRLTNRGCQPGFIQAGPR